MANFEPETQIFYSSLIVVTIALFRLVSETFACDRQKNGRTNRQCGTGRDIVAGQLANDTEKRQHD